MRRTTGKCVPLVDSPMRIVGARRALVSAGQSGNDQKDECRQQKRNQIAELQRCANPIVTPAAFDGVITAAVPPLGCWDAAPSPCRARPRTNFAVADKRSPHVPQPSLLPVVHIWCAFSRSSCPVDESLCVANTGRMAVAIGSYSPHAGT